MKYLIFLSVIFLTLNCENTGKSEHNSINPKTNISKITGGDYEVLQSNNLQKAKETLIVVIDPHGDGKFALSHFKKTADNFDCTIIGLNDVENNQKDYMHKIENDIKSAKENLDLDVKYLLITGFSGGARMAFQYALSHKTGGVLMCGAGINIQKFSNLSFPLAMIIGTKDFNFIEQYYSPYSPVVKNKNVLTLLFEGIHEWPPKDDILTAMTFLLGKNGFQSQFKQDFFKKGDDFFKEKDYFKAFKSYEAYYKMCNDEENKTSETALNNLLNNESFKKFINQYESALQKEIDRNNQYIQLLNENDLNFWHNEILKINHLRKSNDSFEAASYARTKAYLGIAMYSFVNREITNPWSKMIDKYLKIYEMLEPENPDLWFFKFVRAKQKNNAVLCEKYLKRAFAFGFKDSLKAEKYDLIH